MKLHFVASKARRPPFLVCSSVGDRSADDARFRPSMPAVVEAQSAALCVLDSMPQPREESQHRQTHTKTLETAQKNNPLYSGAAATWCVSLGGAVIVWNKVRAHRPHLASAQTSTSSSWAASRTLLRTCRACSARCSIARCLRLWTPPAPATACTCHRLHLLHRDVVLLTQRRHLPRVLGFLAPGAASLSAAAAA